MASGAIVKHFDVIKDISSGEIAGFVDTFLDTFFLQATKERLGNGIVPTVAASTRARFKLVFATEPQPVTATVLRPLVGMHDHRIRRLSSPDSHQQRVDTATIRGYTIGENDGCWLTDGHADFLSLMLAQSP